MSSTDPNKLFRVKLGQGEPVLRILLSEKAKVKVSANVVGSSRHNPKGMVRPKRRRDESIVPKSAKPAVTFWDLGQLTNGDTVDFISSIVLTDDGSALTGALTTSQFDDLIDYIRLNSEATWASVFKKIPYAAEGYGLAVRNLDGSLYSPIARVGEDEWGEPVTTTKWTSSGLTLTGGTLSEFRIESGFAFLHFNNDPDEFKITTTFDYSATGTSFTLQHGDKVFLVPSLSVAVGTSQEGGGNFQERVGSKDLRILERSFYLTNYKANGNFMFGVDSSIGLVDGVPASQIRSEIIQNADCYVFIDPGPTTVESPSGFPRFDEWDGVVGLSYPFTQTGAVSVSVPLMYEGQLCGVIQRGSTFYYFWSKTTDIYTMNSAATLLISN